MAAYRSPVPSLTDRCPTCGFDPSTVSPSDAAAAARSYPRRWRGLLVRPDDADPEIVRRRPGPDEPSALELAAEAAATFALVSAALDRIRVDEEPSIDVEPRATPAAGALEPVLATLEAGAETLAAAIERYRGEAWQRPGRAGDGTQLRAIDVARHGVHRGIHNLRQAERVLQKVR